VKNFETTPAARFEVLRAMKILVMRDLLSYDAV
jgi:hypothetical protein